MELTLAPELAQLRDSVRRLLAAEATPTKVRAAMDTELGHDPALWQQLGELGALGLVVPETYGGAEAGHVARTVVAEELGRALVPSPFLGSSVLAVDTLLALGDGDAAKSLLPGLASGETLGALAVSEGGGGLDADATKTAARQATDGYALSGSKTQVVDGAAADVLLVYAATDDGPAFFRVDAGAAGLTRTPLTTLDPTRRVSRVGFDATPAVRLEGDAGAALALVADHAAVALGGDQVGGMVRATELTVEYAKIRVQFGRPIGSYQAVKHACADMHATCEQAISAVRYAAWAADHDPVELPMAAAVVRVYVAPGYFDVAKSTVLHHGGVGYTWDHDAHLFYKRAKSDQLLFGAPREHRAHLADLLER